MGKHQGWHSGSTSSYKGKSGYHSNQQWGQSWWGRGRSDRRDNRDRSPRRHSSRRTHSSSTESHIRNQVTEAQRILYKHDPEHRKIMDQHQKQAQEAAAKEQGAAIINAVKSEFDAYLQVHRVSAGLVAAH